MQHLAYILLLSLSQLLGEMTIEEKLGQLNMSVGGDIVTGSSLSGDIVNPVRAGQVGAVLNLKGAEQIRELQRVAVEESRLGIPLLFCMDVIHGYETVYPIPLALSCSWDTAGIRRSAEVAAIEATADGIALTFSPMVDVSRDARWGRVSEGNGEDPFLGAAIARAMVEGYQGTDLADPRTMMACMKHFALYGAVDAGREYAACDASPHRLYNEYLPPYQAAVDAGVGSVMASLSTINGVPATASRWLLTDLLRHDWGFRGFVMSDYTAVKEMQQHGAGSTLEEVSILALQAGLDMDMVSGGLSSLVEACRAGRVSMSLIDSACMRVLRAKEQLGLFRDPYRYCDPERRPQEIRAEAHRAHARQMARESMVLLRNEGDVMPLKKEGTIALIGPLADTRYNMAGTWSVAAVHDQYRTLREGLQDALVGTSARLLYAKGCNVQAEAADEARGSLYGQSMHENTPPDKMIREAVQAARKADVILLALGETSEMAGECASRVHLELPAPQQRLVEALLPLHKPMVLLHWSGRPTVMTWENEHLDAILQVWFGGSETADAVADILFGDYAPCGRLTMSFPRHVGQLPMSYRQENTGRPLPADEFVKYLSCYADVPNSPLFPFGYGLSYTTFRYSAPVYADGQLRVRVTNTGARAAAEVVQLYVHAPVAMPVRPTKELRGFRRLFLASGETQEVVFSIDETTLGYYRSEDPSSPVASSMRWVAEEGDYELMVGHDSQDLQTLTIHYASQSPAR